MPCYVNNFCLILPKLFLKNKIIMNSAAPERIVFLDYLRVIACFMVVLVHCIEPFYLGGEGTLIKSYGDGLWTTLINSALRAAVPLFVLASSYLLFPVKTDSETFYKKRFTRILIPLLVWSVLYAIFPYASFIDGKLTMELNNGETILKNFKNLGLNFAMNSGHLWFMYMLAGLYIIMPILSPWVEKLSKRGERWFIGLWLFTTTIPFLRVLAGNIFGLEQVWGEAAWNEFGTFYYVSGFIGYLMIGHYFRKHVGDLSWGKTLAFAIPLWFFGYAITAGGFWIQMPKTFPVEGPVDIAVDMELTWCFSTLGVALSTIAYFLIIKKIKFDGGFYKKIILPISKLSFGMYLMHMFILVPVFSLVSSWNLNTPTTMLTSAAITFVITALVAKILSFLPKSKWIVG